VRGTIAFFSAPKGWGFVTPQDGGADVFVHHSNILMSGYRKLDEGDVVEYEVEQGPKGRPQACRVTVVQKAQAASARA
jgi:CspA family cold shock protein